MTATLDLRCPKCGLPLRLQRPTVASEIGCPKCRYRFGMLPDGKIISVAKLDAFSTLPEPIIANAAPAKPKGVRIDTATPPIPEPPPVHGSLPSTPTPTFQSRVQPRQQGPGIGILLRKSIVPIICIAITAGIVAVIVANRDRLPATGMLSKAKLDTLVASLPMTDSHEKVLDECKVAIDEASRVLQRLSDSNPSTDTMVVAETIDSLQKLKKKMDQLTRRAASMDELPKDRFNDASDPIVQKLIAAGESARAFGESVESINLRTVERLKRAGELNKLAKTLASDFIDFPSTLRLAWQPLDVPRSPIQEIEYEVIVIQRALWRSMVAVDDDSSYQALAGDLNSAAEEFSSVAARYRKLENRDALFRIYSRYFDPAISLSRAILDTHLNLQDRFGELNDKDALQRYVDAYEAMKKG